MNIVVCSCVDSDLVRSVASRIGAGATAFTTISETDYRRLAGGPRASRLWLRWRMNAVYAARLVARILLAQKDSLWVVTTNPFFAPGLAACAGRLRGQKVIHHVFDLYPDALEAAGLASADALPSRLVATWTRFTQGVCAASVYLGKELKRHTEARHGKAKTGVVIAVSADERDFSPAPVSSPEKREPLRLHYGGQLGAMHDAEGLAAGVAALHAELGAGRVKFQFMINSSGVRRLGGVSAGDGVEVVPTLASAEWRREVVGNDIGLVALTPGGMHVCLPSKVHAMMAAGLAIIAICPERSDLAALVRDTGAGWVVDNTGKNATETGRAFARVVREALAHPERILTAKRAARRAAESTYGHEEISRQWRSLVADLSA